MLDQNLVPNRSEILFLYDVTMANPNGDPVNDNKPRIDEVTGKLFVTDVRLKRTIRDYIKDYLNKAILIKEYRKNDGKLMSRADILKEYNLKSDPNALLGKFIDVRLFGATFAVEKDSKVYTGPVQFNFGFSLHPVEVSYVKGTTVMSSETGGGKSKGQGTFTAQYVVPYALIAFHGIVNEHTAVDTRLTDEDVDYMLQAMWHGTKNLITRSKFGQMPRLLLQVVYKENAEGFFIGELDKYVKIETIERKGRKLRGEEIRSPGDYKLDLSVLKQVLDKYEDKIEKIRFKVDDVFKTQLQETLKGFETEELK